MVVGFYVGSFFCFASVSCTLTGPWVKKQFFYFPPSHCVPRSPVALNRYPASRGTYLPQHLLWEEIVLDVEGPWHNDQGGGEQQGGGGCQVGHQDSTWNLKCGPCCIHQIKQYVSLSNWQTLRNGDRDCLPFLPTQNPLILCHCIYMYALLLNKEMFVAVYLTLLHMTRPCKSRSERARAPWAYWNCRIFRTAGGLVIVTL